MLVSLHLKKEYSIDLILIILFTVHEKFIKSNLNYESIIPPISQILLIIVYFIEEKLSKINEENKKIIIKWKKEKDNSKQNMIILLIFIIILQICYEYCEKFKKYSKLQLNHFIRFIFIYIIDLIKFQNQIYSHHIISMIMNFIILIVLILIQLKKNITPYYYIPYFIVINYSFSLSLILIKYLNIKYFMNIYLIASIIGLFKLLYQLYNYYIVLSNIFSQNTIILTLIILIGNFVICFLQYYLIYKIGILHLIYCFFLSVYIILIIQNIFNLQNIIILLFLILSTISAMIYLEILELNFCGLNDDLKEKIKERAEEEKIKLENSILNLTLKDITES